MCSDIIVATLIVLRCRLHLSNVKIVQEKVKNVAKNAKNVAKNLVVSKKSSIFAPFLDFVTFRSVSEWN